ncbi:MAG: hypothetical protein IKG14_04800 [Clostridia bacterium]|nr:hypothetical protein [Clostridia bacterium]
MKTKIIKVIGFVIVLIILLLITSHIFVPKSNTEEAGMHDYEANGILAEKERTIDLLILGDSEAFTSIIPMQLWNDYGFTSYVCCSTAQTIPESMIFLIKALQKQQPKMIILEASNIYTASERDEHIVQVLNYMFPVVEYHDRWKYLKSNDWFGEINYDVVNDLKGYHFTKDVKEALPNNKMAPTEETQPIPIANKIYIKLLKKYCEMNDIKFSIIRTPTTFSWDYKSYNGVKQFADAEKIEYLDLNLMNDQLKIDWKQDSKDGGDHLNHYGAVKNTKFIGEFVKNKNLLTDHRKEEKYSGWNKSYEEYKRLVK